MQGLDIRQSELPETNIFVYRIDNHDRIVYVNSTWLSFAAENDAHELTHDYVLNKSLRDFINGVEAKYVFDILVKNVREKGIEIKVPFNCDSPDSLRRMEMTIRPFKRHQLEFRTHLIENHNREHIELFDRFTQRNGELLTVCSLCKKIYVKGQGWIEAAEAIKIHGLSSSPVQPRISEGICQTCMYDVIKA